MKNTATRISIAAIIITSLVGFWLYTSSSRTERIMGIEKDVATSENKTDGVQGPVTQSGSPAINPLGSAAGGIVDARSMSVAEVVANLSGTSEFASLFSAYGASQVSGSGKFTVFVPTDGAFSQFPKATLSGMSSAEKSRLVQYHIVKGRAMDTDAMSSGSVQAASGDVINFNYGTNKIPMVGNAIIITQFNCKNGVVYTVDNVLLPPKK